MTNTIHHNFIQDSDAEGAKNALLAAGFRSAAVKVNSHAARPADAATSAVGNVLDALTPGGSGTVGSSTAGAKPAALISVDTDDDDQRAQAEAILARFGGTQA